MNNIHGLETDNRNQSNLLDKHCETADSRFACHKLDDEHCFYSSVLPNDLTLDERQFESLWDQHPNEFHEIMMHGRLVKTPRWQQAYGKDYHYTGNVNRALPLPAMLEPLHRWCQDTSDSRAKRRQRAFQLRLASLVPRHQRLTAERNSAQLVRWQPWTLHRGSSR